MHKERNAFGRQPQGESALLRALRCDGSRRTQAYGGEGAIVAKQFTVIFLVAVIDFRNHSNDRCGADVQTALPPPRVGVSSAIPCCPLVDFNPAD